MANLSLPVLALVALGAFSPQEEERDPGTRFFAMPMSRGARELAATAKEHLSAERWSEGIAILQSLYEEHGAEILPQEWRRSASEYSQFAAHPGAAEWALDQLLSLPAEASSGPRRPRSRKSLTCPRSQSVRASASRSMSWRRARTA